MIQNPPRKKWANGPKEASIYYNKTLLMYFWEPQQNKIDFKYRIYLPDLSAYKSSFLELKIMLTFLKKEKPSENVDVQYKLFRKFKKFS